MTKEQCGCGPDEVCWKCAPKEFAEKVLEAEKMHKKKITPHSLAEFMHNVYEEEAVKQGWQTQKSCKVSFDSLPEKNKAVMLKVAEAVIAFLK